MDARDLMVNNIIQYNDSGEHCRVKTIEEFGMRVEFSEEETYIEYDQFSPVLLTEEILVKCGFINGGKDKMYYPVPKIQMEFHATLFHGQWIIEIQNHVKPIVTDVVGLHQLQNLIYAITGNELTIEI